MCMIGLIVRDWDVVLGKAAYVGRFCSLFDGLGFVVSVLLGVWGEMV